MIRHFPRYGERAIVARLEGGSRTSRLPPETPPSSYCLETLSRIAESRHIRYCQLQ